MRISLLIIFLISLSAESEEWSNSPSYLPACSSNYQSYWSRQQKLSDAQKPLAPPHIDDVNEAEKDFKQCSEIAPSRYSATEEPSKAIKWFIHIECMNSKGWFFKISPVMWCLSDKNIHNKTRK